MKRYLPFFIVALVAAMTVTGATLLYRAKRPVPQVIPKAAPGDFSQSVHAIGPDDATVVLEEFGDFQCPPCGGLSEPIKKITKDFPKVRLVFKNFPLAMHQHALEAAMAAEAAGLQGRFWEMHDLLYREQAVWSKATDAHRLFSDYAAMLRCNTTQFKKDMTSQEIAARVQADLKEGSKLGVKNTPTIFLNNTAIPPAQLNPTDLRAAVEEAMKATPAPAGK